MLKFRKVLSPNLSLLVVSLSIFLNNAVYGIDLPVEAYLRIPFMNDNQEKARRFRKLIEKIQDHQTDNWLPNEMFIRQEIFLYGRPWNPKEAVKRFDLAKINDEIVNRIIALGIPVNKIPVKEGTPEELKDAQARYLAGEILIDPLYTDQTGEAILSAMFYDNAFRRNHFRSNELGELKEDSVARMRHLVEDLVFC